MTSIDKQRSSLKEAFRRFFESKSIIDECTEESLLRLKDAFSITDRGSLKESELQTAVESVLNVKFSKDEFHLLFTKINVKGDGSVTWDEFISHLILEQHEKDETVQWQSLGLPLSDHPQILRTHHRTAICKIVFYPEILPDKGDIFRRGRYLTASGDGTINYWSLDLEYQCSVRSKNPFLKVQSTMLTDMIVMPDIQIVCTSSIEGDLRFYDTTAEKFVLRVLIYRLKDPVVCMHYHSSTDVHEDSYLIAGDTSGSLKIMSFNSTGKGPFKREAERELKILRYDNVLRGELTGLTVREMKDVHTDWVSQVSYHESLRALISASLCPDCSLLLTDPAGTRMRYEFALPSGISCFTFCEESQVLVTGGPDCVVRTWNPFVPRRPSVVLHGHRAGICALVIQYAGTRLYSLSNDRCVKVWDVVAQSCIQTYNELPNEISDHSSMSVIYNTLTKRMIIAGMLIAVLTCERVVDEETSDGYTHAKSVSCVLYNNLFKMIVTTGFDSCIMVWEPWQGRRLLVTTRAHTRHVDGFYENVEITAACFDLGEQSLLTGARDGTLKIWNFRTGSCLRRMAIDADCEVTSVVWLETRILCTGWDRRVTEFAICGVETCRKNWETRHASEILCSSVFGRTILASGSQDGDVVLWRLETGQLFRKYRVTDPTGRFTGKHEGNAVDDYSRPVKEVEKPKTEKRVRQATSGHQKSIYNVTRRSAVCAVIFLNERPVDPRVGTLLVSLDSGLMQVWSHHPAGGFLLGFSVIHAQGDCAISLATDPANQFLVTGHRVGYIKVWLLANYALPNAPAPCMPRLRLEFPFLWKDRLDGRAKRAHRDQNLPILLSSSRGHNEAVTCLQIIPDARIIVSGSKDHTVRLWTLGGRYISTLGTFREWSPILPDRPAFEYFQHHRLPADIKRTASFTTMKVFQAGSRLTRNEEAKDAEFVKEVPEEQRHLLYGRKLPSLFLTHRHRLLSRGYGSDEPLVLDTSLPFIPVYTHFKSHALRPVELSEWLTYSSLRRESQLSSVRLSKSLRLSGSKSKGRHLP